MEVDRSAGLITGWLRDRRSALERELVELVAIPSHAAQPAGVAEVAERIEAAIGPIGFRFQRHRQRPTRAADAWIEDVLSPGTPYSQLAGTWTARRASSGGRGRLVLLGDLDTAFPAHAGARLRAQVQGRRLVGPGVADMKGGLVVLTAALRALAANELPTPEIHVVLAGDEQAGSLGSRRWIERALAGADWCLCVECARAGGRLMAARGHIGIGIVTANGREAHTGSAHASGVNAIDALARVLVRLPRLSRPDRGIYVTATLITGGRRRSVMPALARATIDVRTPDAAAWARTVGALRRVVDRARQAGDDVELRLYDHRPGVPWNRGAERLLRLAVEAGEAAGVSVEAIRSPAAGSSAFAGPIGVPTLDGLGPIGGNLMTPDEYIELDSLVPRAALLAGLIWRLGQVGPGPEVRSTSRGSLPQATGQPTRGRSTRRSW